MFDLLEALQVRDGCSQTFSALGAKFAFKKTDLILLSKTKTVVTFFMSVYLMLNY